VFIGSRFAVRGTKRQGLLAFLFAHVLTASTPAKSGFCQGRSTFQAWPQVIYVHFDY
jgi:hypothetical protein